MRYSITVATMGAALTLVACDEPTVVVGAGESTTTLKAIPTRALDILFVIDDSGSMVDKQAQLAAAFPLMIDKLGQLDIGLPDLHIGVTTPDLGTSPAESELTAGVAGCAGHGRDGALTLNSFPTRDDLPFLRDVHDGAARDRNFDGELRDAFTAVATVGAGGCGYEQHLAAMSRVFDNPLNAGFLRPEANLAVVIVADEDDCSMRTGTLFSPDSAELGSQGSFRCFRFGITCDQDPNQLGPKTNCTSSEDSNYIVPVAPFVERLIALKGDQRKVMVSVVAGDTDPVGVELQAPPGGGAQQLTLGHSCSSTSSGSGVHVANPAIRLRELVDGFPGRGTWSSICDGSLVNALGNIASTAKVFMGDPCLDTTTLADIDAAKAGVQPECEVIDVRDSAPDAPISLPDCATGAGDCFELTADATVCPDTSDHLRIRMQRAQAATDDTWTQVRCRPSR